MLIVRWNCKSVQIKFTVIKIFLKKKKITNSYLLLIYNFFSSILIIDLICALVSFNMTINMIFLKRKGVGSQLYYVQSSNMVDKMIHN